MDINMKSAFGMWVQFDEVYIWFLWSMCCELRDPFWSGEAFQKFSSSFTRHLKFKVFGVLQSGFQFWNLFFGSHWLVNFIFSKSLKKITISLNGFLCIHSSSTVCWAVRMFPTFYVCILLKFSRTSFIDDT